MSAPATIEPLIRPPRLHTGRPGDASRLELFFDLAYVVVVLELAAAFVQDLTGHGLGVFVGLFVAVWVSWVGFTLYANRFDTDDVVFRVAKLLATLSVAGCAASASDATGKYAVPFAASFLAGRVLLFLLYVRAWRHVQDARPTIAVYLVCISISASLWMASLAASGPARYVCWGLAVLVDALGPLLATLRSDKLPLHIEHLPERFGLFVILVLGEAVGGTARGVHDAEWATASVLTALGGFVVAAAMWWIYFDVAAGASARRLEEADEESADTAKGDGKDPRGADADERHDLFVYGHLPMCLGIVAAGIGLEVLVLHPADLAPTGAIWVLCGGLALFLTGITLVIGGTARAWAAVWPWPVLGVPVLLAIAAIRYPASWTLVVVAAVLMLAAAALGTLRSRQTSELSA
jgi:low temperature requirement protein LtrA